MGTARLVTQHVPAIDDRPGPLGASRRACRRPGGSPDPARERPHHLTARSSTTYSVRGTPPSGRPRPGLRPDGGRLREGGPGHRPRSDGRDLARRLHPSGPGFSTASGGLRSRPEHGQRVAHRLLPRCRRRRARVLATSGRLAAEGAVPVPGVSSALVRYDGIAGSGGPPTSCRACATTSAPMHTAGGTATAPFTPRGARTAGRSHPTPEICCSSHRLSGVPSSMASIRPSRCA
jgi:hypothetical protein